MLLHKECLPTELATLANQTVIAATFDDCAGNPHVPGAAVPTCAEMTTALAAKADLVGGVVPASQLPSYVDDVLEYANLAAFPATGESGKIYTDIATGKTYRWSGTTYTEISASALVAVKDEGATLTTAANSINFVGAGVTATNVGGDVTVAIPKPITWTWNPTGDGSATLTFSDGTTLGIAAVPAPAVC